MLGLSLLSALVAIMLGDPETLSEDCAKMLQRGVGLWQDIPLCFCGSFLMNNKKISREFGMEFTSLNHNISQTVLYYRTKSWPDLSAGLL